jgi:C-terminal processing protease CtpA/Prc
MPSVLLALIVALVLIWAGFDWRWAWLLAGPLGIALALRQWWAAVQAACVVHVCAGAPPANGIGAKIRIWGNARPIPGGKLALLVLSFHLICFGRLGLQYDSRDIEVEWVAILGNCIVALGVILLLQVCLACVIGCARILRANQPWPARAAGCAAWGGVLWFVLICANSRNSLDLVNKLAQQGIQVFTQARYLQEQMRVNYLLASVQGTPKPAWHELIRPKSIGEALAQSRHPADRWSHVAPTANARAEGKSFNEETENFDHGITVFGIKHARAQGRPELAKVIVRVDPGSPADKAGVKRGDVLERYAGESAKEESAIISQAANGADGKQITQPITISAPAVYRKSMVSDVSFMLGDTLLADVPKKSLHSSPLPPSESINGLYLAVHGFDLNLEQEFKRKLEFAYGLALGHVPKPFFMRDIETVVLDLRSNGGGYTNTIFPFAHALMGAQFQKGKAYYEKSLDEYHPKTTPPKTLPIKWYVDKIDRRDPLFRLQPKRLIVLTSPYTCSAAELFIHGIREQLRPSSQIIVIGEPTCGKPYGYPKHTYFGYQHVVINQATVDVQGQPAYPKGIQPDCIMRDNFKSELLSKQDALWEAARHVIQTGQCQAAKPAK